MQDTTSVNLIIVETDKNVKGITSTLFEKPGEFSFRGVAKSLKQAFDMIKIIKPELVVFNCDEIKFETFAAFRFKYFYLDFILVTKEKKTRFFQNALRAGVFDVILKPFDSSRLYSSLTRYKQLKSRISCLKNVDQNDIDLIFQSVQPKKLQNDDMPKGIDPITLKKIQNIINKNFTKGVSAETLGEFARLSRITARRYLEFLVSRGIMNVDLSYGVTGRPGRKYFQS